MAEWLIVIISVIVGTFLGFGLNLWRDKFQEKKLRRKEALEIHFKDIQISIMEKIAEMARSFYKKDNRLLFGSYSPVQQKYPFEQGSSYQSFIIHFPKIAAKWNELNKRALKLQGQLKQLSTESTRLEAIQNFKKAGNPLAAEYDLSNEVQEYEDSNINTEHEYNHLQSEFKELAVIIKDEAESIAKYEIGTVFTRDSRCPICKKF